MFFLILHLVISTVDNVYCTPSGSADRSSGQDEQKEREECSGLMLSSHLINWSRFIWKRISKQDISFLIQDTDSSCPQSTVSKTCWDLTLIPVRSLHVNWQVCTSLTCEAEHVPPSARPGYSCSAEFVWDLWRIDSESQSPSLSTLKGFSLWPITSRISWALMGCRL